MKCAIIGVGRNVEDLHIPALMAMKDVRIEAACDIQPERLNAFGRKYGIKRLYATASQLLNDAHDIDFIDVSTPGFTHFDIARDVIEAGKHFMIEKPFTLSLAETRELRERTARKRIKVCIIHNYRYRNNVLKARRAYDRGVIGRIREVKATYRGPSVFDEPTPWSWDEQEHRTFLYELPTIHLLDLQIYFAGPVEKVLGIEAVTNATLKSAVQLQALVKHVGGAVGIIDFQLLASSNYTHFELFGSANDIRIKFYPEYYRIYSGTVNPLDEVHADLRRIWDFVWPIMKNRLVHPAVDRRAVSHYRLFRDFVDALKNPGTPIPVTIDDVYPTMELLDELSAHLYPARKSSALGGAKFPSAV